MKNKYSTNSRGITPCRDAACHVCSNSIIANGCEANLSNHVCSNNQTINSSNGKLNHFFKVLLPPIIGRVGVGLLLLLIAVVAMGQEVANTPPYQLPQTPNVAAFMKNIDHPVGLYHGNPEISHTLYTLKDGAIELPITLQYNASGIKVNEEASWVGLGWNLQMGGMVVQNVIGVPDGNDTYGAIDNIKKLLPKEFRDYFQIPFREDSTMFYKLTNYGQFYANMNMNKGYWQPDVYSFFYPGGSGKFFVDCRDKSVHLLEDNKKLKIELINGVGWNITTSEGICHTFSTRPNSITLRGVPGNNNLTSNYYLTKTAYPNGQQINYNYESNDIVLYSPVEVHTYCLKSAQSEHVSDCALYPDMRYPIEILTEDLTLKSITTTNYNVTFNGSNRDDLSNGRKLDEIKINSKSYPELTKQFNFTYDYFVSDETVPHWITIGLPDKELKSKRLKLVNVYECDEEGNQNDLLNFDYLGNTLPLKNSYAIDYWGYYNGQIQNTSLIPNFKYLLTGWYSEYPWVDDPKINVSKSIRAYDFNSCVTGMLKRVNYPMGGYMEYTYEPHEFGGTAFIPTVSEIKDTPTVWETNSASVQNYNSPLDKYIDSIEVAYNTKIDVSISVRKGDNTWEEMNTSRYLLEHSNDGGQTYVTVKNEYLFFSEESNDNLVYYKNFSVMSEGGLYRLSVFLPTSMPIQNQQNPNWGTITGIISAPIIKSKGYNYGAGVRVKQVNYHDGLSDSKDYTLNYNYPDPIDNAILFNQPIFSRQYDDLWYAQVDYDWSNYVHENGVPMDFTIVDVGFNGAEIDLSGSKLCSAPYSSIGSSVGYSQVEETRINIGRTCYRFTNKHEPYYTAIELGPWYIPEGEATLRALPPIPSLSIYSGGKKQYTMQYQIPNYINGNGNIESISHYNEVGSLISSESNQYSYSISHPYFGIMYDNHFNRTPYLYNNEKNYLYNTGMYWANGEERLLGMHNGQFTAVAYPVNSYRTILTSKTVTEDGVTTTHNYTYDDSLNVVRDEESRSDSVNQTTTYTYPYNYTAEPYATMTAKHEYAYPVETKQFVDGKTVSSKLTEYGSFPGNLRLPSAVSRGAFPTTVTDNSTFINGKPNISVYPYADATFLKYDDYGNPVNLLVKGEEVVLLWSYGGQYLVAEIKGSTYDYVQTALGNTPDSVSDMIIPDFAKINSLRTSLPDALVTTYTYQPLVGMTSATAPDGTTTYYEYDSFGRLKAVKDNEGNIIAANDYHYQGSTNPSTLPGEIQPIDNNIVATMTWRSNAGSMDYGLKFSKPTTGRIEIDFYIVPSFGGPPFKVTQTYSKGFGGTHNGITVPNGAQTSGITNMVVRKLDTNDPSTYTINAVEYNGTW